MPPQILWDKAPASNLNQIYKSGLAFCLLSPTPEGLVPIMPLVFCKDYLHDVIWASLNTQRINIHGLLYDPATNPPVFREKTLLGICNQEVTDGQEAERLRIQTQDLLQQVEKLLDLVPTVITPVDGPSPLSWLVEGDARWMLAAPLISFYSLLLRSGEKHTLGMGGQESLDQMLQAQKEFSAELQALNRDYQQASNTTRQKVYDSIRALKAQHQETSTRVGSHLELAQSGIKEILECGLSLFPTEIEQNYPADLPARVTDGNYLSYFHSYFGIVGFSTTPYYRQYMPILTKNSSPLEKEIA